MRIGVDLRSLSSGTVSGVENYTLNLLDHLLKLDKSNQYVLFYNAFSKKKLEHLHFVNSEIKTSRWPNKLLNLAFKFNIAKVEKFTGPIDVWFMPNLNQFSVNPSTKVVITVHDLSPVVTTEFYDTKRKVWHKFLNYKTAYRRANLLLAVSEYTKQDLIRLFNVPEEKVGVVYPGVDKNIFRPDLPIEELRKARNFYGLPGEYFLFLNTIEPRKNLKNLIKAFELVKEPISLVIAGRLGWKFGADFRLIKRSKKSAKIKYIGYIEEQHKPTVIKLAKALVYPSFYEGFGFVPLEAMAVGTPVISSQLASLPEVVGDAGLLINPYSVESIYLGLNQILSDEALARILKAKGERAAQEFSWDKTAEQTLAHLNNLKFKS